MENYFSNGKQKDRNGPAGRTPYIKAAGRFPGPLDQWFPDGGRVVETHTEIIVIQAGSRYTSTITIINYQLKIKWACSENLNMYGSVLPRGGRSPRVPAVGAGTLGPSATPGLQLLQLMTVRYDGKELPSV